MPHGPLGDRIPFEGVLNCWNDDHDLPDLLLAISRSGKTGRLHFSNPEGDKTLDLQGGKIVFAESSSQDDGLGQFLLRTGRISLMDYTRVSKLVQPGKRLGALLVDENVLASDDLVPAVVGQVRSVILGLFRRTETWYRFKEEELGQNESITLNLAVPELILEGVRYVESWRRVSKGVGSLESVYQQAGAREQEWLSSKLDDGVRELVNMLATPTSLQEICTRATLPDFEACRYLWAFRALGWIDVVDEDELIVAHPRATAGASEPTTPEPADTPTLPSIQRSSIPAELAQTQLAIDPPSEPVAAEEVESPEPSAIPEHLIQTQVSMATQEGAETPPETTQPTTPPTPKPVPADLHQTQLVVEPPPPQPPESPAPKPVPEHLRETQISVEPPTATPPDPRPAIPDELMHTQMFVEAPPELAPAPPSTGEFMESILDGDDPAPRAPELADPAPPAPPAEPTPPSPPSQAATQFFDGPNALDPMDEDLAAAPTPPAPEPSATPAPTHAPSGFEALALGGGLDGPAPPPPAQPIPTPAPTPSPADTRTEPSVQPPPAPPADQGMASFSDLALPEAPPAKAPVPMVEADVLAPDPVAAEEPLLPPPVGGEPLQRDALVPPRRRGDNVPTDKDDFGHLLNNDEN